MDELYNRILKMGIERGYKNMTAICTAADVKRATMTEYKKGRTTKLSIDTLLKFAVLYNVPVEQILRGEQEKGSPFIMNSKPVDFDIQIDDGLTDKQRNLINLVAELPDNVVSLLLSAAKDWLKNQQSSDSV